MFDFLCLFPLSSFCVCLSVYLLPPIAFLKPLFCFSFSLLLSFPHSSSLLLSIFLSLSMFSLSISDSSTHIIFPSLSPLFSFHSVFSWIFSICPFFLILPRALIYPNMIASFTSFYQIHKVHLHARFKTAFTICHC